MYLFGDSFGNHRNYSVNSGGKNCVEDKFENKIDTGENDNDKVNNRFAAFEECLEHFHRSDSICDKQATENENACVHNRSNAS